MSPDGNLVSFRRAPGPFSRRDLREFAGLLRRDLTSGRPFACLITDDRELLRLNRVFLQRDYPADVLSFPSGKGSQDLGEIAISVNRAFEQAGEIGHPVSDELKILMLHGVLHLLGLDHESDRGRMARTEKKWRTRLNLPAGLIERASI
ncbi:MAG: rRNA maturation RNase YbeY [Bryobacteraceae bacterium]